MTKAKLTRIPKRVLACVLAVLMVLSCLTMLPFTGFAANLNHAKLESPAVVQDGSKYYAFGSGNVLYESSDMADWGTQPTTYVEEAGMTSIQDAFGDSSITAEDLKSPEVVQYAEDGKWYLYLSIMDGSRSMIVVGTSENIEGPYNNFQKVLETGFNCGDATDVLQSYFSKSYEGQKMPAAVEQWGKGTCYYYSNFLGLNYQWFTEELPRAYAPSIAADGNGNYYMAYGYRNGGIWLQKIDPATGLIDFTWSGDNWNTACEGTSAEDKRSSDYHYLPEEHYDTNAVETHRLDPYFGELVVHTTEGGDTDTLESSVSRAGEEPELYFVNGTAYLQVTYGGAGNGDGYNVRSYTDNNGYKPTNVTNKTFNFVDMNDESGVNNATADLIDHASDRTGLKLMGDYNLPGTASDTYYTAPGASSVTAGADGMLFYNYQVKTNYDVNGLPTEAPAELRSHIMLHNSQGDPLVTPFEYTGSGDSELYNDAKTTEYDVNDQIVGQYYVTATGNETSASKQSVGGITLTAGGLVMGLISGTWEFEVTPDGYANGVHIYDQVNEVDYYGAFLLQSLEQEDDQIMQTDRKEPGKVMTLTLAGANQTVTGVRYDNYEPGGENNADANLSISPAIYTGGALNMNTAYNGQLGLKYGNYISSLIFAGIDYSTYLEIDDKFTITDVRDEEDSDGSDYIGVIEVTAANVDSIVQAVYANRDLDMQEASIDGADNGDFNADKNSSSAVLLKDALVDKIAAIPEGKKAYILTGYLDSERFGRESENGMKNDKGDISLVVSYTDNATDSDFTERVYAHVYQQPVPANISGAVYYEEYHSGVAYTSHNLNTAFLRAEGSYSAQSTYNGTVRNSNMSDPNKLYAAPSTFSYYNDSLFYENPNYGVNGRTQAFFNGETTPLLDGKKANQNYFTKYSDTDITVSYEQTFNERDNVNFGTALNAGPKAEYYIDVSDPYTSNIADYYNAEDDSYRIPLYYSTIYSDGDYANSEYAHAITFNWYNDAANVEYGAGLYPATEYGVSDNAPLGAQYKPLYNAESSDYAFTADFSQVKYMYDGTTGNQGGKGQFADDGKKYGNSSYSANIWIEATTNDIRQNANRQAYNTANENDYNFYVRTKTETVDGEMTYGIAWHKEYNSHARLASDIEYGVYVTDKSYLRTYYDEVMSDKLAQGYTYYSWEDFRKATRLIADYLNNYMELADMYSDPSGDTEYTEADYNAQVSAGTYPNAVEGLGGLNEVLTHEDKLESLLGTYATDTQGVLCYLLTAAEDELFSYQTYNDFMTAYEKWELAFNQREDYTTSSWMAYMQFKDVSLTENITMQDLVAYTSNSNDSETDPETEIYNPSSDASQEGKNHSWKIIYNEYLGGDARELFEQATDILNHATSVLRHKADYTNLDAQMEVADTMYDNGDVPRQPLVGSDNAGTLDGETVSTEDTAIFDIDRSTVNAIAGTMNQGSGHDQIDGKQYTVSSLAAFDKIYDAIWEIRGDTTTTSTDNNYLDDVSVADAALTDRTDRVDETGESTDKWYSDLVRDDQQRYLPAHPEGEDTNRLSTVQQKINDRVTWVQRALEWLEPVALEDQYQTFDYLIDVISTIDFNAYTPEGQQLLWDKLYELLVEGGVYAVNQQLFSKTSMDENKLDPTDPLTQILYNNGQGEDTYYTGWNAANVDAATTELMTLLTELDETQRRLVTLTVELYMTDTDDSSSVSGEEPYMTDIYPDLRYGDSQEVSVAGILEDYDPANYFAYSWVITTDGDDGTTPTTNYLGGLESYDFIATANTTLKIYVAKMSNPYYGVEPVRVTVRNQFGGQSNEFVMSLAPDLLSEYSVSVSEDDGSVLTIYHNGEPIGRQIAAGRVPFYDFEHWTVNGRVMQPGQSLNLGEIKSDAITILSTYAAEDSNFTVSVINAAGEGQITSGYTFDSLVTITATTPSEGQTFYAWLVDDGYNDSDIPSELNDPYNWKIASYNETYTYLATASERFIQVNKDTETGMYYLQTGEMISAQPANGVLDATSLYYRLEHQLADSWSNITREYDSESGKVSLFSHFTDMGDSVARVTEHGVVAITNPSKAGDIVNDRDLFVIGATGVNKGVSHSDSSSGQSSGQYVVSIAIPESALDGRTIYMRSYATTEYELDADDLAQNQNDGTSLGSSDVFVINYSEIASVELPNMVSATEDGSMEEE